MTDPLFRLQIVDRAGKLVAGPSWTLERDIVHSLPWWVRWLVKRAFLRAVQALKDDTRYAANRYR